MGAGTTSRPPRPPRSRRVLNPPKPSRETERPQSQCGADVPVRLHISPQTMPGCLHPGVHIILRSAVLLGRPMPSRSFPQSCVFTLPSNGGDCCAVDKPRFPHDHGVRNSHYGRVGGPGRRGSRPSREKTGLLVVAREGRAPARPHGCGHNAKLRTVNPGGLPHGEGGRCMSGPVGASPRLLKEQCRPWACRQVQFFAQATRCKRPTVRASAPTND